MKKTKKFLISLSIMLPSIINNVYATTEGTYTVKEESEIGKIVLLFVGIGLISLMLYFGYKLDKKEEEKERKNKIINKKNLQKEFAAKENERLNEDVVELTDDEILEELLENNEENLELLNEIDNLDSENDIDSISSVKGYDFDIDELQKDINILKNDKMNMENHIGDVTKENKLNEFETFENNEINTEDVEELEEVENRYNDEPKVLYKSKKSLLEKFKYLRTFNQKEENIEETEIEETEIEVETVVHKRFTRKKDKKEKKKKENENLIRYTSTNIPLTKYYKMINNNEYDEENYVDDIYSGNFNTVNSQTEEYVKVDFSQIDPYRPQRGRPRKNPIDISKPKRGRGRPRKNPVEEEKPKRGRGRPRKTPTDVNKPKRGRGTPSKNAQ